MRPELLMDLQRGRRSGLIHSHFIKRIVTIMLSHIVLGTASCAAQCGAAAGEVVGTRLLWQSRGLDRAVQPLWDGHPIQGPIHNGRCIQHTKTKLVAELETRSVGDPGWRLQVLLPRGQNEDVLHISPSQIGTGKGRDKHCGHLITSTPP